MPGIYHRASIDPSLATAGRITFSVPFIIHYHLVHGGDRGVVPLIVNSARYTVRRANGSGRWVLSPLPTYMCCHFLSSKRNQGFVNPPENVIGGGANRGQRYWSVARQERPGDRCEPTLLVYRYIELKSIYFVWATSCVLLIIV